MLIPRRNLLLGEDLAICLCQDEPMRAENETGDDFWLGAVLFGRFLDRHRHTEGERFLALPNVATKLLPSRERRHGSQRNPAFHALCPREELISEAVVVKLAVSGRNRSGFGYCGAEQICKRVDGWSHGPSKTEGQRGLPDRLAGAVSQLGLGCRLGAFACYQHVGVPLLCTGQIMGPTDIDVKLFYLCLILGNLRA
jgi:hypothetical protein